MNEKIRVTETDSKHTYTPTPDTAARETDFYLLASENLDSEELPPLLLETILSRVEGSAKEVIDQLIVAGIASITQRDALALALFLAFQITRGRAFRQRLMAMSNATMLKMWENVTDEGIRHHLNEQGRNSGLKAVANVRSVLDDWQSGKLTVGPEKAGQVAMAAGAAEELSMNFMALRWRIYYSQMPLITCDEPVVPIPRPLGSRGEEPGVASAAAIVFPLDPHHLLVMFHPYLDLDDVAMMPELMPTESDQINLEVAAHSDRWLFEGSGTTRTLTLLVPQHPKSRAVLERINVVNEPDGEFFRTFSRNRWHSIPAPPPPAVTRWWSLAQGPGFHNFPFRWELMTYALYDALE